MTQIELTNLLPKYVLAGKYSEFIYKYRSIDEPSLDALRNNYLWFSNLDDFNDPFEGRLKYPKRYTQEEIYNYLTSISSNSHSKAEIEKRAMDLYNNPDELKTIISTAISEQKKETKICCFSRDNCNLLMWPHYASAHKGVCLEFNMTVDPAFFIAPIDVVYTRDYAESNLLSDPKTAIMNLVRTKSLDWQYEKEIRIVKLNEKKNKFYYNSDALVSIIFGCKCSEKDINRIIRIMGTKKKYKKCVLDDGCYKINIEDMTL